MALALLASPLTRAWILLTIAMLSMSAGGLLFTLMPAGIPSVLKACWRLGVTALVQMPLFVYQYCRADAALRATWKRTLAWICVSGVVLAVHFATWAWSVDHTSLTSALLIVSTTPNIYVGWAIIVVYAFAVARSGLGAFHDRPAGGDSSGKLHTAASEDGVSVLQRDEFIVDAADYSAVVPGAGDAAPPGATPLNPAMSTTTHPTAAVVVQPVCPVAATQTNGVGHAPAGGPVRTRSGLEKVLLLASGWVEVPLFPTKWEVLGTLVGFGATAGLIFVNAGSGDGGGGGKYREQTVAGDFASFIAAITFCLYLSIGAHARKALPGWLYVTPVMGVASLACGMYSLSFEGTTVGGTGAAALFGWLFDGERAVVTLAAGIIPGVMGHSFANIAVGTISPLIMSVFLLLEAPIGSIYGYLAGVQAVPTAWTFIFGTVVLISAVVVTLGSRDSTVRFGDVGLCLRTTIGKVDGRLGHVLAKGGGIGAHNPSAAPAASQATDHDPTAVRNGAVAVAGGLPGGSMGDG